MFYYVALCVVSIFIHIYATIITVAIFIDNCLASVFIQESFILICDFVDFIPKLLHLHIRVSHIIILMLVRMSDRIPVCITQYTLKSHEARSSLASWLCPIIISRASLFTYSA